MNSKQPVVASPYEIVTFTPLRDGRVISCGVWIASYGSYSKGTIVVLAEPYNYEGMSVTNAAEYIATEVVRRYSLNPDHVIWIEHYSGNLKWKDSGETFDLVTFDWSEENTARNPDWFHITRETAEGIIGKPVPEVVPGIYVR